ncbi:tetratricopeptide repeat protein [Arthrobacter sp. Soil736]|uniref:tetratricopeptide repeat protein n=1 Tax=Arthrobacter sp. Soil736 TaxID=1736395 RepID=UPI000B10645E|nr:tetratricopeptide repeat protein [Arthrobacter sp. Soil736]
MGSGAEIWRTDPATLRDVVLDRKAVEGRLGGCPPLERVWLLSLLGRDKEALDEGWKLLADAGDRFKPLLVLAQVYQRQYRWHEAAQLQEEALRLASTRTREAMARHQIGRRLFDEARYRDAAAEFEWACDLYRVAGRNQMARVSGQAMQRAREVHRTHRISDDSVHDPGGLDGPRECDENRIRESLSLS